MQREYDVHDAGGIELLLLACESLDRVERLREQIDADGATIKVRGVPKAHPALRDELAGRAFIARTLQRIGLNLEPLRAGPGHPPKAW